MPFSFVAVQVVLFVIAFWFIVLGALLFTERIIFNRIAQKSQVDLKLSGTAYSVINIMATGTYISLAVFLISAAMAVPSFKRFYDSSISAAMEKAGLPRSVTRNATKVPSKTMYVPDNYGTIQKALDAANSGDTIIVRDGRYTGTDNKNLDFEGKPVTLRSENGAENCIIDCEGDGRGFYFHGGEGPLSIVDGFTVKNAFITGPRLEGFGGGFFCTDGASPTIINCVISANKATSFGGGLSCYGGSSAIIRNCTFSGNGSSYGGAIGFAFVGSPTVEGCTFNDNLATTARAIYCGKECFPKIMKCRFTGGPQDAVFVDPSSKPTITDCTYD